jgi:hypothetical protein
MDVPQAEPATKRAAAGRIRLAPLPAYGALSAALFAGAWQPGATVGYGPDPPFFIWSLGWFPFALAHGLNPFVTNYLDYPAGINLMASTGAPLLAVVFWPVTTTLGPVVAYNAAIVIGAALSAWCAFHFCLRIVPSRGGAFVGGLIYGFSPFVLGHALGQLHLVAAMFPPVLGLLLYALLTDERHAMRTGVLLGLTAAAQFYVSEEMLAIEAVATVMTIGVGAAIFPERWRPRLRACLRPALAGAAICGALVAVPLAIQFFGPQHVARAVNPGGFYVSDLLGFMVPTQRQWLAPGALASLADRFTGNPAEWTAYIGLPLLVVAIAAAVRTWHRPILRMISLLALLLALLSLGPRIHVAGVVTPLPPVVLGLGFVALRRHVRAVPLVLVFSASWAALAIAPVLSDILPARLMVVVFLLVAVLAAAFVEATASRSFRQRLAHGLAIGAALLCLMPALPVVATSFAMPSFFATGSELPQDGVVLVAPYAYAWDDVAMVWQSQSGMRFKMPEGYGTLPGPSLNAPPTALGDQMVAIDQGTPYAGMSQARRLRLLADLRRWNVDAVIVGPMEHQAAMVAMFRDLLGRPPEQVSGVYRWSAI